VQPWEKDFGKPHRIVSALDIMIEGPLGGAAFNNEFGRPAINGYFRTFEAEVPAAVAGVADPGSSGLHEAGSSKKNPATEIRGYHKPIMLAGGLGNIKAEHVQKGAINPGDKLIVLGGPACSSASAAAPPARWPAAPAARTSISPASSATTPRWSAAARR
jgi:phosphoribosylformylglycinamidine synthase